MRPAFSPLALGAGQLGAFWQGHGVRSAAATVEKALDAGVCVFDTADVYARGISERIIGRVAARRREEMLICTKVGQIKTPLSAFTAAKASSHRTTRGVGMVGLKRTPMAADDVPRCWESTYVIAAARRSLRRLRVEQLDILLLHSPTTEALSEGRFVKGLMHLVRSGEIDRFGVSCDTAETALEALRLDGLTVLEVPINVVDTSMELEVLPLADSLGVSVLARSPFAAGAAPELYDRVDGIRVLNRATAVECLRYASTRVGVASVVVGMSSPEHVTENVAMIGNAAEEGHLG